MLLNDNEMRKRAGRCCQYNEIVVREIMSRKTETEIEGRRERAMKATAR